MRNFFSLLIFLLPVALSGQILKENQIPFYLNTDSDSQINVIDQDDDDDGFLDNVDAFPLNGSLNSPSTANLTLNATNDAGLRSNTEGNKSNNYGGDLSVQTKGPERAFIVKWTVPANLNLNTATLRFFTSNENDPLEIYFLPNSNWIESTITFNNATSTGILSNQQHLGTTNSPTNGEYSFSIPTNIFPTNGGEITLLIYDAADPNGNTEEIFTKETSGKTPTIELNYNVAEDTRIIVDQSYGTTEFVADGPIQVGFKLSQNPNETVWLPLSVSDASVAKITGTEVLVFDQSNWDSFQSISISPQKPGNFDVLVRPLHSNNSFFNGHNPDDLKSYTINASNISNLVPLTVQTGNTLDYVFSAQSGTGSQKIDFKIIEGPVGLNVVEYSGRLSFKPLSNQIGSYPVVIEITDEFGNKSLFQTTLDVTNGSATDPSGIYVVPGAEPNAAEDGSVANPFNEIGEAIQAAATAGGSPVFIRGGEYLQSTVISVSAAAPYGSPVIVQPLTGEHVKLDFDGRAAFEFLDASKNIEVQGLEIDGNTDEIDFWAIVGRGMWGDENIPRGGGICIAVDGDSISIKNNYLHDAYQKAVEIRNGRYTDVYGNIISHIATTSLSGGHGIMRQQKGNEFLDDDNLADYRWDIYGNLIFNVRQQIYSWVPAKNFMEMTLDEGKPILIDDPQDNNGIQEAMSARIKNNILAFGAVDHIRLKSTPNLEVSNNTVYAEAAHSDGITDKTGDSPTPKFINFVARNNAVQTAALRTGIEIDDAVFEAKAHSSSYNPALAITGNISATGLVKPDTLTGLTQLATNQLFVNPSAGDFTINPALGLPSTLGIEATALAQIESNVSKFGVSIKWDGWTNDDIILTQTILDNIPGVYDTISGNELVFTDAGTFSADTLEIDFTVVNGTWKSTTGANASHEFRLNEEYVHWYKEALETYKNQSNAHYPRIRWGDTHIEQNFNFPSNWLMISQITPEKNTLMNATGYKVNLDGDLLIDFESITPLPGAYYDLVVADSIKSLNSSGLFDYVQFEGYTPQNYLLSITDTQNGQALRLSFPSTCTKLVNNTNDAGAGSLRDMLACAVVGDTITLSSVLDGDTIKITSSPLIFNKNITLIAENPQTFIQNCSTSAIEINAGIEVNLENFKILSDRFTNNGKLTCADITFKSKNGTDKPVFYSSSGSVLLLKKVSSVD